MFLVKPKFLKSITQLIELYTDMSVSKCITCSLEYSESTIASSMLSTLCSSFSDTGKLFLTRKK